MELLGKERAMSTSRQLAAVCCAFCLVLSLDAPAQEKKVEPGAGPQAEAPPTREEIVVTATRTERKREDVPGSVSVITREDMERVNLRDVGDALENLAGLKVTRYGALGSEATVHLRGLYGVHTLVLVDGRPVNAPSLSSADLSWLSLENIDRIEVVRGAASALYGADAMGGVVHILTASPPEKPAVKMGASYGTWNTFLTHFSHGATLGRKAEDDLCLGYLVTSGTRSTDGFRDNSEHESSECDLKLSADITRKVRVTLSAGCNESETGLPGPRPPADPARRSLTQQILGSGESSSLYDHSKARRWHAAVEARMEGLVLRGYLNDWRDDLHQEYVDWSAGRHAGDYDYDTVMHGGEVQYTWDIHPDDSITAGAAIRRDQFDSRSRDVDVNTGAAQGAQWDAERRTASVFIQNELRLEPARLYIGGRWDDPSDFDGQFSGRAGVVYEFPTRTTLRLTCGQAYRAPSLNDLNWPSDAWAQGNPDLKPEKGIIYEFGVEQAVHEAFAVGVTVFRQEVRDMIVWAPTGPAGLFGPKWQPDNLNRAWIHGVEGEIKARLLGCLAAVLRYTFLDATQQNQELVDSATNAMAERNRDLAYAPRHKVDVGIDSKEPFALSGFRASLNWQYQSAIYQYYPNYSAFPSVTMDTKRLSGFSTLNLKLSQKVGNLEIFLAADNLLDEEYSRQFGFSFDDRDYPMPGRSFTGGLSMGF
jgi:outer membrane cobalamin receptor